MSPSAITARLLQLGLLRRPGTAVTPAVDMSCAAVTARLRVMGSLADMCLRLGAVGVALRAPRAHDEGKDRVPPAGDPAREPVRE